MTVQIALNGRIDSNNAPEIERNILSERNTMIPVNKS